MNQKIAEKAQRHGLTCHEIEGGGYCPSESRYCIETEHVYGPRGEYYDYAFLDTHGSLIALGDEQGNYAGGIYAWKDANEEHQKIENRGRGKEYGDFPSGLRDFLNNM